MRLGGSIEGFFGDYIGSYKNYIGTSKAWGFEKLPPCHGAMAGSADRERPNHLGCWCWGSGLGFRV